MGKVSEILDVLAIRRIPMKMLDIMNAQELEIYKTSLRMQIDMDLKAQALKEVLISRYKAHYSMLLDSGDADDILPIIKELREKEDKDFKSDYLFITVSPRPPFNIESQKKFINICLKVFNKPWIKQYCAVFEQRGETDENSGYGFHMHMLLNKGDYRISHLRREFVSSFNRICDTSNLSCFNISYCKEEDIGKRQNYMIGRKADESKWLKQDMDKIWRRRYGISEYYGELFIKP